MEQKLFDALVEEVKSCAAFACSNQTKIHLSYKHDGSVLTESDLAVSERLTNFFKKNAPDCNVVSEESPTENFRDGAPYTFVIDPIDGTDSYSQGIDTWCVSVGILDKNLKPVGAVICAPRFGVASESILVTTIPGSPDVYINGRKAVPYKHNTPPKQMALGSDTLKQVDISRYKGKLRSYGSSVLHLLCPVLFFNIDATLDPLCFPWDIASSHAVVLKLGLKFIYANGEDVHYTKEILTKKTLMKMSMFCGSEDCVRWMQENLIPYSVK